MERIIKTRHFTEFYMGEENCFITEIFNTTSYNNFSIAQARVPPYVTTEAHKVADTDEVYYILSGKGEMEVNGNVIGTVEEKDIVFIPRNKWQRIKNLADEDLVFLCICSPRFDQSNYKGEVMPPISKQD